MPSYSLAQILRRLHFLCWCRYHDVPPQGGCFSRTAIDRALFSIFRQLRENQFTNDCGISKDRLDALWPGLNAAIRVYESEGLAKDENIHELVKSVTAIGGQSICFKVKLIDSHTESKYRMLFCLD